MSTCKWHKDTKLNEDGACPKCGWTGKVDKRKYQPLPEGEAKQAKQQKVAEYIIESRQANGIIESLFSDSFESNYKYRSIEELYISGEKVNKIILKEGKLFFHFTNKIISKEVVGKLENDWLGRKTLFTLKDKNMNIKIVYRNFMEPMVTVELTSAHVSFRVHLPSNNVEIEQNGGPDDTSSDEDGQWNFRF